MIKLWWKPKYWVKKHHKVAYKRKMPKSLGMQKKKKNTQKFGNAKKKEKHPKVWGCKKERKKTQKKNNMHQVLEKIKMVQY